jgi:hypothetical protein
MDRCKCKKTYCCSYSEDIIFIKDEWYHYVIEDYSYGKWYNVQINEDDFYYWNIDVSSFIEHFYTVAEIREIEIDKIIN